MSRPTICCWRLLNPIVSHARSCWSSRSARAAATLVVRQMRKPFEHLFERVEGIGELTEAGGPFRRASAVLDCVGPRFGA